MASARNDREKATLRLFGGPGLWRSSGEPVPLTPSHGRLLTLIWGHDDRGITRGSAIWFLWEEDDTGRTRQRIRQLLHELRTRAGFRPVAGEGDDELAPRSDLVSADTDEFRNSLSDHQFRKALSIYERGFASRLEGRARTEAFDDWLQARRETLRRRLREAAATAWDGHRPAGGWPGARDAAEVLAALDPESEGAVMKLAEARAMTGAFQASEAAVADFLARMPPGYSLGPESRKLLDRLRHLAPVNATLVPTSPPPPPLVGRRHGLATARAMLGRVAQGSFEFLLIRGEGGSGKTRIMEEVWKEAKLGGFRCLEARPVELERRIPLNPLVDMLGDPNIARLIPTLEEPWRSVIASLLPTLPPGMDPPVVPPIQEASLSRRLYDAFANLFSALTEDEPLLLFIDDLHWVDATTVAVLQFVQRRWRSGALGIVATVRPDMITPSDAASAYLAETQDLPVATVELGDLTDSEARTLVDLVAEQGLDPLAASRLCALGGRNPFYLIELTRDYVAGRFQLPEVPTDALTLPVSLRQILEPRIARLDPAAAETGSHLAVWGRWITLPELSELTGTPMETCSAHAEELERCRLATVERGRIRLAHELFRSAMYQSLSATRKAVLHGKVAAFLEGQEGHPPGELAVHHDRAGNAPGAAARAREAADRAMESGAMTEAAYFLQLVVDNVADARLKAVATGDLARALHMNREILRANPLLELAASRLRAVGESGGALRMDIRRVEGLAELGAAPLPDLLDRLATIKSLARSDGDDEALALSLDAELHLLHRSGKVPEIRRLFEEIRPVTRSPNPVAACLANASLALNVLFGDADEALQCAREAVRVAEGDGVLHALSRLIMVLVTRGEMGLPEWAPMLSRATELADRSGDLALRFHVRSNQGVFFLHSGDLDRAESTLEAAGTLLSRADASLLKISHCCNMGELYLLREEPNTAWNWFDAADKMFAEGIPAFYHDIITAGLGLCAIELGALSEARACAARLKSDGDDLHYDPFLVLHFRSRLHERLGNSVQAFVVLPFDSESLLRRFPITWLRIQARRWRLAKKAKLSIPPAEIDRARDVLERLGLARGALLPQDILEARGNQQLR